VHVISRKVMKEFAQVHPAATGPLHAWHRIIESTSFQSFADLWHTFNSVDKVEGFFVFNLGGNKFRLVAAIHFNRQKLYIRAILTHEQYDDWRP
jgi:mRNA interferase HigB